MPNRKKNYYDMTKDQRKKEQAKFNKTHFGKDIRNEITVSLVILITCFFGLGFISGFYGSLSEIAKTDFAFVSDIIIAIIVVELAWAVVNYIIYYINFINWLDVKDNDYTL